METIGMHEIDDIEVPRQNMEWCREDVLDDPSGLQERFIATFFYCRDSIELLSYNQVFADSSLDGWMLLGRAVDCLEALFTNRERQGETVSYRIGEIAVSDVVVEGTEKVDDQINRAIFLPAMLGKPLPVPWLSALDDFGFERSEDNGGQRYFNAYYELFTNYFATGSLDSAKLQRLDDLYDAAEEVIPELTPENSHIFYLYQPRVDALEALVANDHDGFNAAITAALKHHSEWYGSTKKIGGAPPRCRRSEGYLSLDCSALTRLAIASDFPINYSSDYLLLLPPS